MQFDFSDEQASYLLGQVENDIAAFHNHIACAVEHGREPGPHDAQNLVRKLRKAQNVAAVLRAKLYPVKLG